MRTLSRTHHLPLRKKIHTIHAQIRIFSRFFPLITVILLLAGCAPPVETASSPFGLPTRTLRVHNTPLHVEIADTPAASQRGLMFRESLDPNAGMLFVFPQPKAAVFYMRNTTIPLSIAYLDSDGLIKEIYDLQPLDETAVQSRSDRIQFAIEVNQGWFERHNITPGHKVTGLPPLPN